MKWRGRRESGNVIDRRRGGGAAKAAGGVGIGGIAIVLIGMFLGVDLTGLVGLSGGGAGGGMAPSTQTSRPLSETDRDMGRFVSVVLADTEDAWNETFRNANRAYEEPKLVLFSGQVRSACGLADAAVGPFYCPGDRQVYLDTDFFDELHKRFGASGDFAQAYVIAHEVGHHVQTLLGISAQVQEAKARASEAESNALQVKMELQADCFAGLWAHNADRNKGVVERGDIQEALGAAAAVGDDNIQKRTRGHVVPDSFTHGSSEQRQRWFLAGYETGSPQACDTFSARTL